MYFCKLYAAEASGLLQAASCSWFLQFFEVEKKPAAQYGIIGIFGDGHGLGLHLF